MGILLKTLKKKIMQAFVSDIQGGNYYVFESKTSAWPNDLVPTIETEAIKNSLFDTRKEMLIGKKIFASDTAFMINRNVWTANTVYAQYSDTDPALYDKNFYIINSNKDVYKCVWNENNSISLIEPTSISIEPFTLTDGYTWKYMYTLTRYNEMRFATSDFIPIDLSTVDSGFYLDGTVNQVTIDVTGQKYEQSFGKVTGKVSNTIFRVDSMTSIYDTFNGMTLHCYSGSGSGSVRTISGYNANSSGEYITVSTGALYDNTSEFSIAPSVIITGDGSGAAAYCNVFPVANGGISSITVVNPGSGYNYCDVEVKDRQSGVPNLYGFGAVVSGIIAPPGGHAFDPVVELGSEHLCISVDVNTNEGSTVNTDISFRQVGIISDPVYVANNSAYEADTFDLTINTPIVKRFSGEVLYYDNVTEVVRNSLSSETIRLVIKF